MIVDRFTEKPSIVLNLKCKSWFDFPKWSVFCTPMLIKLVSQLLYCLANSTETLRNVGNLMVGIKRLELISGKKRSSCFLANLTFIQTSYQNFFSQKSKLSNAFFIDCSNPVLVN